MSIFGSIVSKIFGAVESAVAPAAHASEAPASSMPSAAQPTPAAQAAQPAQPVDVEAVLTSMASKKGGGGSWRTSIVDLLKLLDHDSSLSARKELAEELNVHIGADGSAEENI